MLPGFRFLFAAVVLSISTLVFGLGAAALLRASHERFASLPVSPPTPALTTALADVSPRDAAPPTLALLRLDAPQPDEPAAGKTPLPDGDMITAPTASEPPATAAALAPETPPETAPVVTEAIAVPSPEPPGAEPAMNPVDLSQPVAIQTEPVRTDPIEAQPARTEPVETAPVATTAAAEPRPAPLEPTDAPIRTAMLAPAEPAPSVNSEPSDIITGPVPLPRSRQSALARDHAAQRAAKARRLAAARARQVVRTQPAAAAPAPAFPFQ